MTYFEEKLFYGHLHYLVIFDLFHKANFSGFISKDDFKDRNNFFNSIKWTENNSYFHDSYKANVNFSIYI